MSKNPSPAAELFAMKTPSKSNPAAAGKADSSTDVESARGAWNWELEKQFSRILAYASGGDFELRGVRVGFEQLRGRIDVLIHSVEQALERRDTAVKVLPVLSKADATKYVGYGDEKQFQRWCARWRVGQCARGRYRTRDLDLALEREGGLRHTPASLRRVRRAVTGR